MQPIEIASINELAESRSPSALPFAAGYLFFTTKGIAAAARLAVAKLLDSIPTLGLIQLAESMGRSYSWANEWHRVTPQQVESLAGPLNQPGYVATLGLLSLHRNGYVRHEAVRLLSSCSTHDELPYLILRQNDHVPIIAERATIAVSARLNSEYVNRVTACLPLILHLDKMGRRNHGDTISRTLGLLCRQEHEACLIEAVNSPHREVRRLLMSIGLREGAFTRHLVKLAIESNDPHVRLMGCRYVTAAFSPDIVENVLERLAVDESMAVRLEVAGMRAVMMPSQADEVWQNALLDESRTLRGLAQFMLRQSGRASLGQYYRDTIARCPENLAGLEGLAECGDEADVPFFDKLLAHKWPSRRVVAIRALSRITKEEVVERFVSALDEPSSRVLREIRTSLTPYLYLVDPARLLVIAVTSNYIAARQNAVRLLKDLGKWRGISWLLRVVTTSDEGTSLLAVRLIEEWFSPPACCRVFTQPTQKEVLEIAKALELAESRIPTELLALLNKEVRS